MVCRFLLLIFSFLLLIPCLVNGQSVVLGHDRVTLPFSGGNEPRFLGEFRTKAPPLFMAGALTASYYFNKAGAVDHVGSGQDFFWGWGDNSQYLMLESIKEMSDASDKIEENAFLMDSMSEIDECQRFFLFVDFVRGLCFSSENLLLISLNRSFCYEVDPEREEKVESCSVTSDSDFFHRVDLYINNIRWTGSWKLWEETKCNDSSESDTSAADDDIDLENKEELTSISFYEECKGPFIIPDFWFRMREDFEKKIQEYRGEGMDECQLDELRFKELVCASLKNGDFQFLCCYSDRSLKGIASYKDREGRSIIHIVAQQKSRRKNAVVFFCFLEALRKEFACPDYNGLDSFGYTPLAYASKSGAFNVASLLISHGAEIFYPCRYGDEKFDISKNPIYLSRINGCGDIGRLLIVKSHSSLSRKEWNDFYSDSCDRDSCLYRMYEQMNKLIRWFFNWQGASRPNREHVD